MKKPLKYVPIVGGRQTDFAERLGVDVRNCTVAVALARIEDAIAVGFHGVHDVGRPTDKQAELAAKFGYDISIVSRREGTAVIEDIMTELNLETIDTEGLIPGVTVMNIHDKTGRQFVISSVQSDGTVYFRGGNGTRAWARSLRRMNALGKSFPGTFSSPEHS